jgi:hypothetical protein
MSSFSMSDMWLENLSVMAACFSAAVVVGDVSLVAMGLMAGCMMDCASSGSRSS